MSNAEHLYEALKRIAEEYESPDELRKYVEKRGVYYEEVLEMAYKSIKAEAREAIKELPRKPTGLPVQWRQMCYEAAWAKTTEEAMDQATRLMGELYWAREQQEAHIPPETAGEDE